MHYSFRRCCATALLTLLMGPSVSAQPIRVTVRQTEFGYQLYRNGAPYFIKGAGLGDGSIEKLAACGANSLRTWGTTNAGQVLDEAQRLGLTVMLGLSMRSERRGFDYNDADAVAEQLRRLRAEVLRYKDHPALLLWGIGNELNHHYTNPNVWQAVNDIARMIHEVDPNHPTSTVLAGINQRDIGYIQTRCPAIDILATNQYGGLPDVPRNVREFGWKGAYLVTEWGPTGWWETTYTDWKAPLEETSTEKAAVYKSRYERAIGQDTAQCVGSYVFLWGQKQERTPTWFGLFQPTGEATEVVDVMQYLWTGRWPTNRAPRLDSLRLAGQSASASITLRPRDRYPVRVFVRDPEGEPLTYRWELLGESTATQEGGDRESRPGSLPGLISGGDSGDVTLQAPEREGAYRLFVYAADGHNHVATANIPFYVKP